MINKFYLWKFCASSSDLAGACAFGPDDRCSSFTQGILEFELHNSLSPENGPFGKLNKPNQFLVCDRWHHYFPILYVSIRFNTLTKRLEWNMIREWSSNFSTIRKSMLTKLHRDFKHILLKIFMHFKRFNGSILDWRSISWLSRPSQWNSHKKISTGWSWCQNSDHLR
jgi:hypothetical protein